MEMDLKLRDEADRIASHQLKLEQTYEVNKNFNQINERKKQQKFFKEIDRIKRLILVDLQNSQFYLEGVISCIKFNLVPSKAWYLGIWNKG